jgi:platelet-activating factor acetylhydrolase
MPLVNESPMLTRPLPICHRSVRARHDDFSDFPAIIPFRSQRAAILNKMIQRLSVSFLNDLLAEELAKEPRRDKVVGQRKGKKVLEGSFGEVLVHS